MAARARAGTAFLPGRVPHQSARLPRAAVAEKACSSSVNTNEQPTPQRGAQNAAAGDATRRVVASETLDVVPVIQEQILVGKRLVETATVEVTKTVTEGPEPVHVVVAHDETHVERVPVNRFVENAPEIRYDGDTMIIPVLKEVAVVEKKLMLVEELHVTKRAVQTQETEYITVRREHLEVKRTPIEEGQAAVHHLSYRSGSGSNP